MKQVFRFDSNGFYIEPVILQGNSFTPADCTEIQPQDGLFKGQFVNGAWVEGMADSDIEAIKNAPKPLTELEQIKKQQADLTFTLMMAGVI